MVWEWGPSELIAAGALVVSVASIVRSERRARRAEERSAAAERRAEEAHEIALRAETRAEQEEARNRVRFQYDSHENVPGLYDGDVEIHLLQVGSETAERVSFDAESLLRWSVSGLFTTSVPPGGRASIQIARNRFGELPHELVLNWRDGKERREQTVPLPAELYREAPAPDQSGGYGLRPEAE